MEIIFHGKHDCTDAVESIKEIMSLLNDRYHIKHFREMHLSITLVDDGGIDVELVDSETQEAYRTFDVYRQGQEYLRKYIGPPSLKLVIDNMPTTKK